MASLHPCGVRCHSFAIYARTPFLHEMSVIGGRDARHGLHFGGDVSDIDYKVTEAPKTKA